MRMIATRRNSLAVNVMPINGVFPCHLLGRGTWRISYFKLLFSLGQIKIISERFLK